MLEQVEQSIALGWVEFIDMGVLARDSGFNVLAHIAAGGSLTVYIVS